MDQIKALLEQLATILAELEALTEAPAEGTGEGSGDTPPEGMSDERAKKIKDLESRADRIKAQIEHLQKVEEKKLELRSILAKGASVKQTTPPGQGAGAGGAGGGSPEGRSHGGAGSGGRPMIPAQARAHRKLKAFQGPDAEERAYRAGMHLLAYHFGREEARRWCVDNGVEARDQHSGVNALGGALTSDELSTEIIRLVEEYGAFPAEAKNRPITEASLTVARRTGGLTAYPIGENQAPTTSNVNWNNSQFVPKLWGIDNRLPNSLLEDSPIDLADQSAVECAQAYAEAFDNAGLIGDGSGTYHGTVGVATAIVDGTHSASVVTAATGNITFGTLDLEDFINLIAILPVYARRNAKFYVSSSGYAAAMLRIKLAAGGNTKSDVAGGDELSFMGYPVVICHPMTSALTGTNSSVACLFGDMSQAATFGIRRQVSIVTDRSRFIEYDQTLVFATARVAMAAHDLGTTTNAGPLVALKFASS